MPTKLQLKLKNKLKTLTQGLLLGGLLTGFVVQSHAALREFGIPQSINVEAFSKKMLAAPLQGKDKPDALIILPWEIDGRGTVELLDADGQGTRQMVEAGKGGLVAVRLVDEAETARTKKLTFQKPQYLQFGNSGGFCVNCEWENDVVVGDMNKDTHLDIVVLNAFTKTVTIFYNDGNGQFDQKNSTAIAVGAPFSNTDHPFQLSVSDFNQDGEQDIAIQYIVGNTFGGPDTFIRVFFTNSNNYAESDTAKALIPYFYGSPYYTINPGPRFSRGEEYYQLTSRDGQLFYRTAGDSIQAWKPNLRTNNKLSIDDAYGPFGLAHTTLGRPADLMVINGGQEVRELATGKVANNGRAIIPGFFGKSFITGDFDLDGTEDFATVLDSAVGEGTLRVGFGDKKSVNAFSTATQFTHPTSLPWKWNPVQMVAGNFFNIKDPVSGNVFQDIAVLGNQVTIFPNANGLCDRAIPSLDSVSPNVVTTTGENITLRGMFRLNSRDAITQIILTGTQTIPITRFKRLDNNTVVAKIPDDIANGMYDVSVANCEESNKVQLTLAVEKPIIGRITPQEVNLGGTVQIEGQFLRNPDVFEVVLIDWVTGIGVGQFGMGAGPGTFSFNGNDGIVFTLPAAPFRAGKYYVGLSSPKGFSGIDPNFVLTIK